jgi:UDP-N-acetylglucosamine 2-epimerase (non-hydrolysing)
MLSGRNNVHVIEPLDYLPFVALMNRSMLILTGSRGVHEEATALGKPVIVMQDTMEWPEVIRGGTAGPKGTGTNPIVDSLTRLLTDREAYKAMAQAASPYGDGKACQRIVAVVKGLACLA